MPSPSLVWFRQDLRLADNPALLAAANGEHPIVAIFVLDETDPWPVKGAARWWLHHSLRSLENELAQLGVPLILRRGDAQKILPEIAETLGISSLHWNRCYDGHAIARDKKIKIALTSKGVKVHSHNGSLLFEPWAVKPSGGAYKVFSPFWRACLALAAPDAPQPKPQKLHGFNGPIPSDSLDEWNLRPSAPDWASGFKAIWSPGETGAHTRLAQFLESGFAKYAQGRDIPGEENSSRLSPYLRFGEISPRQIWHAVHDHARLVNDAAAGKNANKFLSEIGWREFSYHLLYHFPHIPEQDFREDFQSFPWRDDPHLRDAWRKGQTGIPIVDAGMRQLWATGWMHNRVRMIAGSFLVKHLLQHWRQGEDWFWDTLVDADLANNAASWQWVAGTGADAAPYFRIFNPVLQGQRFDAQGIYVRRWVPEIARLPDAYIQEPWKASPLILREAGIELGRTYPYPLISLVDGRKRALDAFHSIKREAA